MKRRDGEGWGEEGRRGAGRVEEGDIESLKKTIYFHLKSKSSIWQFKDKNMISIKHIKKRYFEEKNSFNIFFFKSVFNLQICIFLILKNLIKGCYL